MSTSASLIVPYTVHKILRFYQTPEYFYLKPAHPPSNELGKQILSINRLTNEIILITDADHIEKSGPILSTELVDGIFGIIKLIAGSYLILITESIQVGYLQKFHEAIFKIKNVKIIPFNSALLPGEQQSTKHLSNQQLEYNRRYLLMIQSILKMPNYYYSYSYDLSSSVQRTIRSQLRSRTMVQGANMEYVWNRSLITKLMENQMFHYFCLPIVCGFVSIQDETINQKKFKWILISRRSTKRCGTRWFARGINTDGWVANFIETEQILLANNDKDLFSLIQIRGSIPLFWSQLPNLRYKPSFIIPNAPHIESYGHHVRRLSREYGRLCFVNLISSHGSEGKLLKSYSDLVTDGNFNRGNDIPFVNFESFDFHHECRRYGWQALDKLMAQISTFIDEYGYVWCNNNQVNRLQQGVIRSNCIDSLDRTNVVQSLIGKKVLRKQLIDSGIWTAHDQYEDYPQFNFTFSNIWADHADVCSTQYAGTGALKSDFTRTGKRRMAGVLADGLNSLIRYYKNNFEDGFRQDSLDLILGTYQVDEREGGQIKCPLENRNVWKIFFLPLLFLFSTAMFASTFIFGSLMELHLESALYSLFWLTMSSICFIIMYYLGNEFADYPTLVRRR